MLGLAAKSGHIASGEFAVERAIKTGTAYLLIVAEDASENTRKKYSNSAEYYNVPLEFFGTRDELGDAIGKAFRAAIAITDQNLARAVSGKIAACNTK